MRPASGTKPMQYLFTHDEISRKTLTHQMEQLLEHFRTQLPSLLILDMSEVRFLDEGAVRAVAVFQQKLEANHHVLIIAGGDQVIREALRVSPGARTLHVVQKEMPASEIFKMPLEEIMQNTYSGKMVNDPALSAKIFREIERSSPLRSR